MQTETNDLVRTQTRVSRRELSSRTTLLWAVLIALAARLIVVAFVYPSFLVPGREHWLFGFEIGKIAESIVQGHGFGNLYYGGPTGPTTVIAPVLPYIMAGIFALFGIYTKAAAVAILSINSAFSAFTCIPIYFVAKKSFGVRIARWAIWGWAFFPYAIYFSADSMWDHALLTLLVSCFFWAALQLSESPRRWLWSVFGALCGFSALVNPVVLGVAAGLAAWVCYRLHLRGRPWLRSAALCIAVVCAMIAPWLVRNYRTFREPVFLKDNLPLELCVGNLGTGLYWWNGALHPSGNPAELSEFHRLGEQGYMAHDWVEARNFIDQHPVIFVGRSIRRFVYVWTGFWSFNRKYLQEETFDIEDIPFRTALTLLMLVGIWRAFRQDSNAAVPYILMLFVFPLAYYVTHPEIAYRSPIDPEIVMLACYGLLARKTETEENAVRVQLMLVGEAELVQGLEARSGD